MKLPKGVYTEDKNLFEKINVLHWKSAVIY